MSDAVVVGSGPNGLAAALVAARAGLGVTVFEAKATLGGGARTVELLETGFSHDVCSAVHPMALASPFFAEVGIEEQVEFIVPEISYSQAIHQGTSAHAFHALDRTIEMLGRDGAAWRMMFEGLVRRGPQVGRATLTVPRVHADDLRILARLGATAALQTTTRWRAGFSGDLGPGLLAGLGAHAIGNAHSLAANIVGLTLGVHAHSGGWPLPRGGSQSIVDALVTQLRAHGVRFETGRRIDDIRELDGASAIFLDVTPRAAARMLGEAAGRGQRNRYRKFRYGPGVAKVDYTLDGPVPWTDPWLASSGTIHLGGSAGDVYRAEREIMRGVMPAEPFVTVSVPTMFDPSRAPAGKHVVWAYVHTPSAHPADPTEIITRRIEQFAPGFRDLVRGSRGRSAADYEHYNENYIGGDIAGGRTNLAQLLARPVMSAEPWRTSVSGVYLCSGSTAPGPGVHGMAGAQAAALALRREFGLAV